MAYRNNVTQNFSLLFSAKVPKFLDLISVALIYTVLTNIVGAQTFFYDGYNYVNNGKTETADDIDFNNDTIIVTGNGSTLTVTGQSSSPYGEGVLSVSGGGNLNLQGMARLGFDGDALFDNAFFEQQAGTELDVTNGKIIFDNGTIVKSAGYLSATGGVQVNDYSVLNVDGAGSKLTIQGGDLHFSETSTLGITINSSGNMGQIDADGNDVFLNGNLLVTPEYGYYTSAWTKPIILNGGSIDGGLNDYRLSNSNRYGELSVNGINLTFNPSLTPYSNFTQTFNQRSVGKTFDAMHQQKLSDFLPLMRETWAKSDAELLALYNDLSGEIRAETMAMPLASPGRKAFDRVGWDSATGHVFFGPQYRLAAYGTRRAAWFRPYYVSDKVESDGNASPYTMDGYGFVGGIDQTLAGGKTAVGVMLGYGRPELDTRKDRAKLDDFLIGAYIAARIMDAWEIKAWGGYGYQYYDMQRRVDLMGTPYA